MSRINHPIFTHLGKSVAKSFQFGDPIQLMRRLRAFSQHSEFQEPIELLRAGAKFHARGLINSKAIQHNLDWLWPFWINRQYDPQDVAFTPRAFSFSHINLTHRNWTALGLPGLGHYAVVDPRGLLTPFHDSWSLDACILFSSGELFAPAKELKADQFIELTPQLKVSTQFNNDDVQLNFHSWIEELNGSLQCVYRCEAMTHQRAGHFALTMRPYNPEGISFLDHLDYEPKTNEICVNHSQRIQLDASPQHVTFSDHDDGDVLNLIQNSDLSDGPKHHITCTSGLATGAALYDLVPNKSIVITATIPLTPLPKRRFAVKQTRPYLSWDQALDGCAVFEGASAQYQRLYQNALKTILLLAPDEVYPGPFTYKRFWYRDAVFMIHSMLLVGLSKQAHHNLKYFPKNQKKNGYFHSQSGEWDSNGQVLWLMSRYHELTGDLLPESWIASCRKGAQWIIKKRGSDYLSAPHAGLMPAGFSAEHLGPNDHYYWDSFWSCAGLRHFGKLLRTSNPTDSKVFCEISGKLMSALSKSFTRTPQPCNTAGIPASPNRRMDAGAIGSIVVDYPLQLWQAGDERVLATVEHLLKNNLIKGAFFHEIVHSGINAYLTLELAQVLLRSGDIRCQSLFQAVADLASPTGQWPEAIHPQTLGGCMGDGQHGWAAAEWIAYIRNAFVLEENDRLIIGAGIFPNWFSNQSTPLKFGPTPTPWGSMSVTMSNHADHTDISWQAHWRKELPQVVFKLPGHQSIVLDNPDTSGSLRLEKIDAMDNRKTTSNEHTGSH